MNEFFTPKQQNDTPCDSFRRGIFFYVFNFSIEAFRLFAPIPFRFRRRAMPYALLR